MNLQKFLKDQVAELHNVTWPTKKQATHIMITVIAIMLLVGLLIAFFDNGISGLLAKFLNK